MKRSGASESQARKDFFHYLFNAEDPETGKPGYVSVWHESQLRDTDVIDDGKVRYARLIC